MLDTMHKLTAKSNKLLSGRALEGCVLYAPLWYEKLQGSPFPSLDQYHHTCTVTGAVWGAQGRYFDGTDDVIACGNLTELDGVSGITIMAWLYSQADNGLVVSKYTDDNNRFHMGSWGSDFYCNVSNGGSAYGATTITQNVWYFAAIVFDGSQATNETRLRCYVNGVEKILAYTGTIPTTISTGAVTLGAQSAVFGKGYIGDVLIYKQVLSLAQISSMQLATKWGYA